MIEQQPRYEEPYDQVLLEWVASRQRLRAAEAGLAQVRRRLAPLDEYYRAVQAQEEAVRRYQADEEAAFRRLMRGYL